MRKLFLFCLMLFFLPSMAYAQTCANPTGAAAYAGFGASTTGGSGLTVYRVTTLANSGAGSLRDALNASNRCIVFDVSGTITLTSAINIRGNGITIDGHTAPGPVIIAGWGLELIGPNDPNNSGGAAHDIIIRGLHFHPSDNVCADCIDSIGLNWGAYNVVIDHNTFYGPSSDPLGGPDEHVGVSTQSHDVTVSWNLFFRRPGGGTTQNLLQDAKATKVTVHHNLFSDATDKNTGHFFDINSSAIDTETTVDYRNNYVLTKNGGEGITFSDGARANVVNNVFNYLPAEKPPAANYRLLIACNSTKWAELSNPPYVVSWCTSQGAPSNVRHNATFYVAGNFTSETIPAGYPSDLNSWNTQGGTPYTAPAVTTETAQVAACRILREGGKQPLTTEEQTLMNRVPVFNDCDAATPPPDPPPPVVNTGNVTLVWDHPGGSGITGFVVERKAGVSGTYSAVTNSVVAGDRTYVDSVLTSDVYCWQVRAKYNNDLSTPTNEVCSRFIPAPSNLRIQ